MDDAPRLAGGHGPEPRHAIGAAGLSVQVHCEPWLLAAWLGPLPLEHVLAHLGEQAELPIPVKLATCARGEAHLVAEVMRTGDRRAEALARAGLARGFRWLCGMPEETHAAETATLADLRSALSRCGWTVLHSDDTVLHIIAPRGAALGRLVAQPLAGGWLRLATRATRLVVADARSARAIQLFALEANRRLRLARLTIVPEGGHRLRAVCDVVLADGDHLDTAVDALAVATGETQRALRALTTPAVAEHYLQAVARASRVATPSTHTTTAGGMPATTNEEDTCSQSASNSPTA